MGLGLSEIVRSEVLSALGWWQDAGVDAIVDESPRDWLASPARPVAAPVAAVAPPPEQPAAPLPATIAAFHDWLATAADIPFAAQGGTRLLPEGDVAAGLMLFADMPCTGDAAAGTLFAGDEGRLLDRMLAAIGRDRASVYLATLSCLRPDRGRFDDAAAEACAALARHHAALAAPRALLLMGDAASRAFTGLPLPQARGRWHDIRVDGVALRAIVTLHPGFLLQHPARKAEAWADLRRLIEEPVT